MSSDYQDWLDEYRESESSELSRVDEQYSFLTLATRYQAFAELLGVYIPPKHHCIITLHASGGRVTNSIMVSL